MEDGPDDAIDRSELERKRQLAGRLARRGVYVALSAPASAVVGFVMKLVLHAWIFFALGACLATMTAVAGMVYWAGNEAARRGFADKLRELDGPRQLPEARVVIR